MKKKKRTWNKFTGTVLISITSLLIFVWVFSIKAFFDILYWLLDLREMNVKLAFVGAIFVGLLFYALFIFMPSFIIDNVIGANKALEDYRKWG